MYKFIFVFLLVQAIEAPAQQLPLVNGKVSIILPPGFITKVDSSLPNNPAKNYPAQWCMISNAKASLAYHFSEQMVDDNGIPGFTDQLIKEVSAAGPGLKMIDDGILLKDGKNIGYIKFIAASNGKNFYYFMFYLSLDDRLLLFTFSTSKKLMKKWNEPADNIAASIKLNALQ